MYEHEPLITYPCQWLYKVIGWNEAAIMAALSEIGPLSAMLISRSRQSAAGAYLSFNVEIWVNDQAQRDQIYETLRRHPAIKMVL